MAVATFGRVDICCSLMGATGPHAGDGRLLDVPLTSWQRCFDINVVAPLLLSRACATHMIDQGDMGGTLRVAPGHVAVADYDAAIFGGTKEKGGEMELNRNDNKVFDPVFFSTAFRLKEGQISSVIKSKYGYHIILVTGRMAGKDVKFDDFKDDVREVLAERFREELVPQLRKTAKIEIAPTK